MVNVTAVPRSTATPCLRRPPAGPSEGRPLSRTPLRRWAGPALAGSVALVGSVLPVSAGTAHGAGPTGAFIDEIHDDNDDNDGTDVGEFVELAVADGTDLTGCALAEDARERRGPSRPGIVSRSSRRG